MRHVFDNGVHVQDIVYGMWACGIHDTYDQELAERVVQVVPTRLQDLSGGELAKLAFALVEEDVREAGLFEKVAKAAEGLMDEMFPRDIAKLVYALGRAQVVDKAFVDVIRPHILLHLERFTYNVRAQPRWLEPLTSLSELREYSPLYFGTGAT
jgi:hypothetical protein